MIGVAKLPSRDECGDCRSVGSNIHPSSQSQKMSIGVVVDSAYKVRHKASSADKKSEPTAYHATPVHQTSVERIHGEQHRDPSLDKETNIPGKVNAPWISAKDKPSALKTLDHENQSTKTLSEATYKLNGVSKKNDQYLKTVNCEILQQGAKGAVSNKILTDDKSTKITSDTLKMKLLEILGPDTLPEEDKESNDNQDQTRKAGSLSGIHVNNQKTHSKEVENFMDGTVGKHADTAFEKNVNDIAFKSWLNSDPIETDSESLNIIMKRPATRSFKRNSARPKLSPQKPDNGLCHSFQKMNNRNAVQTGGKNRSKELKSTALLSGVRRAVVKENGARIEPSKISSFEKNDSKKKASAYTKRSRSSHDKTMELGEKNEGPPLNDRDQTIPEITLQHKSFHRNTSPVKTASLGGRGECHQHGPANDKVGIKPKLGTRKRSLASTSTKRGGNSVDKTIHTKENEEHHQSFATSKNIFKEQENLHSPIMKVTEPVKSPSPQPSAKIDQVRGNHSAAVEDENIFMGVKIKNFGDWQRRTLRPRCNSLKKLAESSDDVEDKEVETEAAENSPTTSLDKSAPEDCSSDSSEDKSLAGERFDGVSKKRTVSSPEVNSDKDSPELFLHRGKRPCCNHASRFDEKSEASPPQKDSTNEEDDVFCVPSCQDEDDSLSRAVTMLAVALKKLESKVKSATEKKSSEILHSTAEGLNFHLQQVKSLIQTDLEKVTSIGKSKRKHVETMFHEQQERLKTFHDNFRKGLNQHIQDIISSIEEMETDQAELKESLKKHKAQHKKILLQVEEEMENKLNDAQQQISNVHKVANEKLLQLKYVIAECLK